MAPHSSVPAWEIPWTEEPGGLQAMGSPTVGRDRAANIHRLCIISPCSVSRQRLWKSEWEGPRRVSRTAGHLERWASRPLVILLRHWSAPQLDPPTSNRQRAAHWRVRWASGGPAPSGGLRTESKVGGHFWPSTPDPPVHGLCASRWAVGGELGAAGPGDRLGIVFCRALEPSAGEGNGTPLQWHPTPVPWTEEPGGLRPMGSRRVGHDWATSLSLFIFMHWRRKWHPTPVFLPGESQGRGSLVGCRLWGRTESDTTEAT